MTSTPDDSHSSSAPAVPSMASQPFFDRFTERQMVIFVLLIGALLYLPFAGSYGLFDPW